MEVKYLHALEKQGVTVLTIHIVYYLKEIPPCFYFLYFNFPTSHLTLKKLFKYNQYILY